MDSTQGKLLSQMRKLETQLSMMGSENAVLKERVDELESRLQILEGPKFREMQLARSMDEHEMPMLAEDRRNDDQFKSFRYVLPKEALFNATNEAIEYGLLKEIVIGTK